MKTSDDAFAATPVTRRSFLAAVAATPSLVSCSALGGRRAPDFASIEALSQGRIGIAAADLSSGRVWSHRGGERFAMCSTFKCLLAGLVLRRVDRGEESLSRRIAFTARDLVVYSPLTGPGAEQGGMTVGELCAATVSYSDNSAANLLLATLGGPGGFTAGLRDLGDTVTRLDRLEPGLNENLPGDPRDTTTPLAMLATLRLLLFAQALSAPSRATLRDWMIAARTGLGRLRAGFPPEWVAGDKTGTSANRQSNDVAFAIPPPTVRGGPGPLVVASFMNVPVPLGPATDALHARVAAELVRVSS